MTFTSLLVVFLARSLIIYIWDLNLSAFSNFLFIGIIASPIKDIILDLFDIFWPAPMYADNDVVVYSGGNSGGKGNIGNNSALNKPISNPLDSEPKANKPIEISKKYVSTGPGVCLDIKQEIYELDVVISGYISANAGPLEQAIGSARDTREPAEVIDYAMQMLESDKASISWLEKVEEYFQAKDAGLEPSPEAIDAFEKRQKRYLGHSSSDNWKGPPKNYNDPSVVRREAKEDLEHLKANLDMQGPICKALSQENFTGPDAKAHFSKRCEELSSEVSQKHSEYLAKRMQGKKDWYDSWDKETLDWFLKVAREDRQVEWRNLLNKWLQEDPANKDIYQKLSKDKINQDFIKKWLSDDNKT